MNDSKPKLFVDLTLCSNIYREKDISIHFGVKLFVSFHELRTIAFAHHGYCFRRSSSINSKNRKILVFYHLVQCEVLIQIRPTVRHLSLTIYLSNCLEVDTRFVLTYRREN